MLPREEISGILSFYLKCLQKSPFFDLNIARMVRYSE